MHAPFLPSAVCLAIIHSYSIRSSFNGKVKRIYKKSIIGSSVEVYGVHLGVPGSGGHCCCVMVQSLSTSCGHQEGARTSVGHLWMKSQEYRYLAIKAASNTTLRWHFLCSPFWFPINRVSSEDNNHAALPLSFFYLNYY